MARVGAREAAAPARGVRQVPRAAPARGRRAPGADGLLRHWRAGMAGMVAVFATYVSFLLWAQFGFLALLTARLPAVEGVRGAMTAMGVAGLVASLLTARLLGRFAGRRLVAVGLAGCALTPPAALLCRTPAGFALAAAAIGAATALLAVALAASLRELLPGRGFGLRVGLATGAAYFVCNLPPLFEASPAVRGGVAAGLCALALALMLGRRGKGAREDLTPGGRGSEPHRSLYRGLGFVGVALAFLALITLDSAAFAVVQATPALKALTWGAGGRKLALGAVHALAAVAAGALLDRGRLASLLAGTLGLFALALPLLDPPGALSGVAGLLYAAGISIYSVALVAYPAARGEEPGLVPRRWRAALVYGAAGWLGSGLGVGLAQELHRIPRGLLVAAGLLVLGGLALAHRPRAVRLARLYAPALLVAALASLPGLAPDGGGGEGPAVRGAGGGPAAAVRRGREVYVAEGCIHCHSQYVRPGTRDVELWGPYREAEPGAGPVLIGNRRQGPDLLNVGNRRSPVWQRLHLEDPQGLVPGSRMPSYAHLFAGGSSRGEALVAYLASLGRETAGERYARGRRLAVSAAGGSAERGDELFAAYCAPCHGPRGRGDGPLAPAVTAGTPRLAAVMDLTKESFWMVPWGAGADSPEVELARVVKLGIGNTPMPGHEYLTDRQVADLVAFLLRLQDRGSRVVAAAPAGGEVRR